MPIHHVLYHAPYIIHHTPCLIDNTPRAIHHASYIIHPALYHAPYLIHHTPYIIHNTPRAMPCATHHSSYTTRHISCTISSFLMPLMPSYIIHRTSYIMHHTSHTPHLTAPIRPSIAYMRDIRRISRTPWVSLGEAVTPCLFRDSTNTLLPTNQAPAISGTVASLFDGITCPLTSRNQHKDNVTKSWSGSVTQQQLLLQVSLPHRRHV